MRNPSPSELELREANAVLERELAEARAKVARLENARDELLASMSHELRTPMMAILGFLGLLEDQGLPEEDRRTYLRTIYLNAQHLLALLNDALDYSKIEAGVLTLEAVPSSPVDVLGDVAMLMGPKARKKGLVFELELTSDLPERVSIDATRLRQILLNLVGNAVKFTQKGGVRLFASFQPADDQDGARLHFEVHDTGVGMTPSMLDALNSRADRAAWADRRGPGMGLGLSLASRLSQMLGGSLTIASSIGEGTTIAIELSAPHPEGRMVRPTIATEPAKEPARNAPVHTSPLVGHILVVEDSIDNQRLISLHLRRAGCHVEVANNGLDAIERHAAAEATGRHFDLVLMDMQMPEMDGYETTRRFRAAGMMYPILAFTAHNLASDRARCLEAGCDDYACKPMDAASLIGYCRRWMGRKSSRRLAA
ncbi:MAG: response regulator [Phycisphaerales bacterium]